LVDTAGLNPDATGIESIGIAKTLEIAARADLFILVMDATRPTPPLPDALVESITASNTLVVLNKADLLTERERSAAVPMRGFRSVTVSALNGDGFGPLLAELATLADGLQTTVGEERIAINVRHAHFLAEARSCLEDALSKIKNQEPAELLASELRGALGALGEISGKVDNERMLDQLFASFCIGK
jgi:tRNA modification GTPase